MPEPSSRGAANVEERALHCRANGHYFRTRRPPKPAIAPFKRVATVPIQFQGEWNVVLHECGTVLNDSRLVIGATSICYYESSGLVQAVVTAMAQVVV